VKQNTISSSIAELFLEQLGVKKGRRISCVDWVRVCMAWNKHQDSVMPERFQKCKASNYYFLKRYKSSYIILFYYFILMTCVLLWFIVDVSLVMWKATLRDNVKQITLRNCLSRKVKSLSFIPYSLFPNTRWYNFIFR